MTIKKTVGKNSNNNIQAENLIINNIALDEDAIKNIVELKIREMFPYFEESRKTANRRFKDFNIEFARRFIETCPDNLEVFKEPSMQVSLMNAEIEYAKSGRIEHKTMLLETLIERALNSNNDLLKIILDACIQTIPLMNRNQIFTLRLIYLLTFKDESVNSISDFQEFVEKKIIPLNTKFAFTDLDIRHLDYCKSITLRPLYTLESDRPLFQFYKLYSSILGNQNFTYFKETIQNISEESHNIFGTYSRSNLWRFDLTSVGQKIAEISEVMMQNE